MSNKIQTRKWLGLALIAVAIVVFVAGVNFSGAMFHGSRFHPGMLHPGMADRGARAYGHHMGPGMMMQGWHSMYGPGSMMSGGGVMPRIEYLEDLHLSEQQEAAIESVRAATGQGRLSLLEVLDDAVGTLSELLLADSPDPAAVGQQYARCAELRRQLLELEMTEWQRISEILNQSQRERVKRWHRYWMGYAGIG